MKNLPRLLLGLALAISMCSCASTGSGGLSPDQAKIIAKTAVSVAVVEVVAKNPSRAQEIIAISHEVRAIAGTEGFNTVDALMVFVRSKVNLSKLQPATQVLAGVLLDEIAAQLKQRVGGGVLTSDKLLIVGEVAGWVEDAAQLVAQPNP